MFLFLVFGTRSIPVIPTSDPIPEYSATPGPTTYVKTPQPTIKSQEAHVVVTTSVPVENDGGPLFITFIALVCAAAVGVCIAIIVCVVKRKRHLKVAASIDADEDELSDSLALTRGFDQTETNKKSPPNTTIFAKSIYSVDTNIL